MGYKWSARLSMVPFKLIHPHNSPVPVQFDWDKIRTEMKPIKMARTKA